MRGRIPDTFIDELLARVDIVDVIERRVPLKKAGREWTACCPFHNERTPSFYVSPAKQFFHCFGCGAHGSAIKFLMDYERLEFPDAVEELAQAVGLKVPYEGGRDNAPREDKTDLYAVLDAAARWYEGELKKSGDAKAYCQKRGLDADTIARFRIGWAPAGFDGVIRNLGTNDKRMQLLTEAGMVANNERGNKYDRFRERLMFPIMDRRGRVIAFGGRVLASEQGPKYLNSPETPLFHKGRELFALWQVKQANSNLARIVVVEGYMDVIALHQAGLPIAVATLGTATTPEHTEVLFRAAPDVVFCFDGDRAGRAAAWKALESALPRLRDGRQAYFLFLPEGEDPDTLVRKEGKAGFEKRLREATALSEYFFQFLGAAADLSKADGRARLRERCKDYIRVIPDGAFRDQMVALLQERTVTVPDFLLRIDSSIREAAMDVFNEKLAETRREMGLHENDAFIPSQSSQAPPIAPTYKRTIVRSAIAILLAQPNLAEEVETPYRFLRLDKPGVPLLAELLDVAKSRPGITTGALLEHFVERSEYEALQRLAISPMVGEAETWRVEFFDALARMEQQAIAQRREILITKNREGTLTSAEKAELRELLAARAPKPTAAS